MLEISEIEKRNQGFELLYIIILATSIMGEMKGFTVDQARLMKAICLLIVVIGAGVLFVTGNIKKIKTAGSFTGVYGFILIGIIVWSMFLWIINLETVDFIVRGAVKFMYQFLVLLIIFSAVYMFGERAIYTTFYGIVLANTIIMGINIGIYGIADSFNSILAMFQGAEAQEGFAKAMEIHDVTFTYGFFIIYFLFFAQHNKERNIDIILAVFFFIIGWKRIALFALPISIFFALIMGRMKSRTRIGLMKFMAWSFVLASFAYVVLTRIGWFAIITDYFGLDSMGRNEVYEYIEKYYNIGLGFMGYGFEYTTVILQQIAAENPTANIGVVALHNNILTLYIELGFLGFWAWMVYTWVFQLHWMLNHWGEKTAMLFFFCELYIFITYATDNTLYYFYTSLVLRLMPLAYTFHQPTSQDIRLWPWVKTKKMPKAP
ncbi:MAG: hypothetical protein IJX57_07985 [Clostridia bacterium]|nr:hypothetical protein [Clostridia bacterium]